jgi:hypothetical protein
MRLSASYKVYIIMLVILLSSATASVLLPQGSFSFITQDQQDQIMSKKAAALSTAAMILFFYGGLGFFGLRLSRKLNFPDLWDSGVPDKKRVLVPIVPGVFIGMFFILADLLFNRMHPYGMLPHPQFPASILATITAAIGEELVFRLFFISFFLWLFSYVIFRNRFQNTIFWIITAASALVFSLGHVPALLYLLNLSNLFNIHPAVLIEILLLNSTLSVVCAYYFRKYGYFAAVNIHFWTDVVWHVIWGLILTFTG